MTAVNRTLTSLFDLVMGPLDRLPPVAGLAALALLTAVGVLLAFKWTSNQAALAATKRSMQAAVLEMRLFNDDLRAMLRAQGEVVRHTFTYVRLSLVPTLWVILPILALMVHMEFHFGYTGLAAGQTALLKVVLDAAPDARAADDVPAPALQAPGGIDVETPAVVLPSAREIVWRLTPRRAGSYELRIRAGKMVFDKTLVVSEAVERRSPVRPGPGFFSQLVHPSEPPLPAGTGVTAVTITYPERPYPIAGWDVGWATVYIALTLVFALALKGLFGVTM